MRQQITITAHWAKFFKLKCLHDFYKDGNTPDFSFEPTYETEILMKNLRFLFRPQRSGFIILADPVNESRLRSFPHLKSKKLSFLIRRDNKEFNNFSNISFEHIEKSFYFSNLNSNITKDKQKLVHTTPFISEAPQCIIQNKERSLSLLFPKEVSLNQIIAQDALGNNIQLENHLRRPAKGKSDRWMIPLRHFLAGKYSIKIKGGETLHFYVGEHIHEQTWGIVDIYFDGIPKEYQLFDSKKMLEPDYFIQFRARETFWKYILINQNKNGSDKAPILSDAKVAYNGKDLDFTKPKSMVLKDGQPAFFIESKKPIKLEEVQSDTDRLEMKLKKDGRWLPKNVKLPKPDVRMLKPDKAQNKMYSTTYVYV